MKNRWGSRFFGSTAILFAILAAYCMLSMLVHESDLPKPLWYLEDVFNIDIAIELFYLAAPFLLLILWVGLYLFHRRQNKIMTLVALTIGIISMFICVVGIKTGRYKLGNGLIEVDDLYAIGVKLPFFVFLIFGILGYRAEGMPKYLGFLTVLVALAFSFSNIVQSLSRFTFIEGCFFALLAIWGVWLGILLWRDKLDLESQAFLEGIRRPGQFIPVLILSVGVLAAVVLIAIKFSNIPQSVGWRQTATAVRFKEIAPTLHANETSYAKSEFRLIVFNPGDLNNEVVQIENNGNYDYRIEYWSVLDGNHHRYSIPKGFTLKKGAVVQIFTREGMNTATELFMGLKEAVWLSGHTVSIYSTDGRQRAYYTIP